MHCTTHPFSLRARVCGEDDIIYNLETSPVMVKMIWCLDYKTDPGKVVEGVLGVEVYSGLGSIPISAIW